jgi:hypothetical protein
MVKITIWLNEKKADNPVNFRGEDFTGEKIFFSRHGCLPFADEKTTNCYCAGSCQQSFFLSSKRGHIVL